MSNFREDLLRRRYVSYKNQYTWYNIKEKAVWDKDKLPTTYDKYINMEMLNGELTITYTNCVATYCKEHLAQATFKLFRKSSEKAQKKLAALLNDNAVVEENKT